MQRRAIRTGLALGVCVAALACGPGTAHAQDAANIPPAEPAPTDAPPADNGQDILSVDAPMADLPDLGVDWPDATPLPALPPLPPPPAPPPIADGAAGATANADAPNAHVDIATDDVAAPPQAEDVDIATGALPVQVDDGAAILAGDSGNMRYHVELQGLDDIANRRFQTRFDALSTLLAGGDAAASAAQILRRAREDSQLLDQLLDNDGYYDAMVSHSFARDADGVVIRYYIAAGPRYHYDAVTLPGLETLHDAGEVARITRLFGINVGDAVLADRIAKSQSVLAAELPETGYPFARVGQESLIVDHDSMAAQLTQPIEPGARLRFGRILADDGGLFGAPHLVRIARFQTGEMFRQSGIEDLRRAIIATGLAASVRIEPQPSQDGASTDIAVHVAPGPLRSLTGAIGYGTGDGYRIELGWQHRNLFPPEGALSLRGVLGTREQLGSVSFRRQNWQGRDRTLTIELLASNANLPAFDARTIRVAARIERTSTLLYQKHWTWSLESELIGTDERAFVQPRMALVSRRYAIASIGGYVAYDGSNDLLDPTRGFRVSARLFPEISFQDQFFGYARAQIDASGYWPLAGRSILAGRLRLATIAGASRDAIAPSRRLYAGGGSSVRGFGYQAVGPRDPLGNPLGGRSLGEFSLEARVPVWGAFSLVPFVDGGAIGSGAMLHGSDFADMRFGAGLGVRYASNFGPIRVDVGTPINPRPGDNRIAVYVSLGQAF